MKIFKFFPAFLVVALLLSLLSPAALALEGPRLTAQAVLLADLESGKILYAQNADASRSPASLTKVMTVLLALEAVERGEVSLGDVVTAGSDCRWGMRDDSSSVDLSPGEQMTLEDLLYCAAVSSGNDACNVIAAYIAGDIPSFVEYMNRRAQGLGCSQTHFVDPHGLSYEDQTSARDLYRITLEALSHPSFWDFCDCREHIVPATNRSAQRHLYSSNALLDPDGIYGDRYVYEGAHGVKTGYTRAAGYCLISTAQRDGLRLLAIVLGSDGPYLSDTQTRYSFVDSVKLYDWAFATFTEQQLCTRGQVLSRQEIETALGTRELQLLSAESLSALFPRGEQPSLELDMAPGALEGPILAGQPLGLARFRVDECEYGSVLLLADRTLPDTFFPDLTHAIFGSFN